MKSIIKSVEFLEEKNGKYGAEFSFRIKYDDKSAYYVSKKKEQDKFVKGKECEFTEEKRTSKTGNEYYVVKPIYQNTGGSNFARAVKKEQSKYSGFAMSYAKDLVVSGKIEIEQMYSEAQCMMDWMVEQDKLLAQ